MSHSRKLKSKLTQRQFYCVKCRSRKTIQADDICVKKYTNKRIIGGYTPTLKGKCNTCGTTLTKFIKHKDEEKLTAKYGKC